MTLELYEFFVPQAMNLWFLYRVKQVFFVLESSCVLILMDLNGDGRMASTKPRLEILSSKWRGCPAADLAGVALFKERSIGDDG